LLLDLAPPACASGGGIKVALALAKAAELALDSFKLFLRTLRFA
jgi:uncharacterized membrane protein